MESAISWQGYRWTAEYDPNTPFWNAAAIAAYFARPENGAEFTAWRDYYYPLAWDKCDFCCLRNLFCYREFNPWSLDPCPACVQQNGGGCYNSSARGAPVAAPAGGGFPQQHQQQQQQQQQENLLDNNHGNLTNLDPLLTGGVGQTNTNNSSGFVNPNELMMQSAPAGSYGGLSGTPGVANDPNMNVPAAPAGNAGANQFAFEPPAGASDPDPFARDPSESYPSGPLMDDVIQPAGENQVRDPSPVLSQDGAESSVYTSDLSPEASEDEGGGQPRPRRSRRLRNRNKGKGVAVPQSEGPGGTAEEEQGIVLSTPIPEAQGDAPGLRCVLCFINDSQHCDVVVGTDSVEGFGCTNCRKLDQSCEYTDASDYTVMKPRPDGLTEPLCCDQCIAPPGGIFTCSWRRTDVKGTPGACETCFIYGKPCTYSGVPAVNLTDLYSHFTITEHLGSPRPPHLQEQQHNVAPHMPQQHHPSGRVNHRVGSVEVARQGWDSSSMATIPPPQPLTHTKKDYCHLCSFIKKDKVREQCNFQPGIRACDNCNVWQLVCLVDGVTQPPDAIRTARRRTRGKCVPCEQHGTNCDRQRPCDSCVYVRGTPALCAGGRTEGTFPRGAGLGCQLYPYLSSVGGGLRGVNDPQKVAPLHRMPVNFHLEYNRWVAGGPLPVPPGMVPPPLEEQPPRPTQHNLLPPRVPRAPAAGAGGPSGAAARQQQQQQQPVQPAQPHGPEMVYASPNDPMPSLLEAAEVPHTPAQRLLALQYVNVFNAANILINCGNANALIREVVRVGLRQDLGNDVPVSASQIARVVRAALDNPYNWSQRRPPNVHIVDSPPEVEEIAESWEMLSQGALVIFNVTAPDAQAVPLALGPIEAWYTVTEAPDVTVALSRPQDHPERANPYLLNPAGAVHPNPSAQPVMSALARSWVAAPELRPPPPVCFDRRDGTFCLNPAEGYCEDVRHGPDMQQGVCDTCHETATARFAAHIIAYRLRLRAYACAACAIAASDPLRWPGSGRITFWSRPADFTALRDDGSGNVTLGQPMMMTGCDCAAKLLGRRLCHPHRMQHYLDMLARAARMKDFVRKNWGRMVCPFCREHVGTDHYNFRGDCGNETAGGGQVYVCLACFAVVVADAEQHSMTLMGLP
ncbi:hypothetical protein F5Y17DRAFT_461836 [Xylariaceae sp. FL0594]|nr:hypothetical protein F5Y17DRAFT_461836 [Xylariaceae sp. FL0594]